MTLPSITTLSGVDLLSTSDFIYVISASAGRLHLNNANPLRFWHSAADLFYRDVAVALQHGNSVNPTDNDYVGAVARRIDGDNMLIAAVSGSRLHCMKFQDGVMWDISSVDLITPLLADQEYWIQARVEDNTLVAAHWDHDPRDGGVELLALEHDLSADEITRFSGNYTFTVGGFWWQQDSWATAYLDAFEYWPLKMDEILIIELDHKGNYTAKPVIEFIGEMSDITITNAMNGQSMIINGTIPKGESRFADIAEKTFTDGHGNNKYSELAVNSKWLNLVRGVNQIVISTTSNDENSGVKVSWRNSWV